MQVNNKTNNTCWQRSTTEGSFSIRSKFTLWRRTTLRQVKCFAFLHQYGKKTFSAARPVQTTSFDLMRAVNEQTILQSVYLDILPAFKNFPTKSTLLVFKVALASPIYAVGHHVKRFEGSGNLTSSVAGGKFVTAHSKVAKTS